MSNPLDLTGLYPPFAETIKNIQVEALKINAYVFDGFRSYSDQQALYIKGRSFINGAWVVTNPRLVVTKAIPGKSAHNYGVAVDWVFDASPSRPGVQWSWDDKYPWGTIGSIAMSHGLEWAGNWVTFKEFPHIQNLYGYTVKELYPILTDNSKGLSEIWKMFDKKLGL
jgi:peptidoglycan L-alanyl-D-glutamate endopeptidase CwlK